MQNIEIKVFDSITQDIISLRNEVYVQEKKLLTNENMIAHDDRKGRHVCIYSDDVLIAAGLGVDADTSFFQSATAIPSVFLRTAYYLTRGMIRRQFRGRYLFEVLLYLTLREGREFQKIYGVILFEVKFLVERILAITWLPLDVSYSGYKLYPGKVDINDSLHKIWGKLPDVYKEAIFRQGTP